MKTLKNFTLGLLLAVSASTQVFAGESAFISAQKANGGTAEVTWKFPQQAAQSAVTLHVYDSQSSFQSGVAMREFEISDEYLTVSDLPIGLYAYRIFDSEGHPISRISTVSTRSPINQYKKTPETRPELSWDTAKFLAASGRVTKTLFLDNFETLDSKTTESVLVATTGDTEAHLN